MDLSTFSIDKIRNLAEDAFNQAKPKTETEAKLYEILSHKNWGSSSTLLNEIARDTYDYDKFGIITTVMWESMEGQRPAAWRVVFKGLSLLEHLIKNGSERCVDDARNHGHSLRALQQFNYFEGTIDRGQGVREKTKQIMEMLSDDERVREERQKARKLREKFGGSKGVSSSQMRSGGGGYGNESSWESGRSGGGGGYGDGGIDSGRSARGRYDDDRDTRGGSSNNTPTFASIPPASDSKLKKKKKKKKAEAVEVAPAPVAPAADLLDFGGDAPAPAPVGGSDDFDTLRSSMAQATISDDPFAAPAPQSTSNGDNFGAFDQAPTAAAPADDFGDFGGAPAAAAPADDFGDFGGAPAAPVQQSGGFDAFGGFQQQQPAMMANNAAMMGNGGMMMQQGGMMGNNTGMMMGGAPPAQQPAPAPAAQDDDDFGDFEAAGNSGGDKKADSAVSSDPLSKLISLDGLSKNSKDDKAAKLNKPIVANSAAAAYQQDKSAIDAGMQQGVQAHNMGAFDSFGGIGGGMPQQQPMSASGGMMNGAPMGGMPAAGGAPMGMMNPGMMGGQPAMGMQGNAMMGQPGTMGMGAMNPGMMGQPQPGMGQMGAMQGGMMGQPGTMGGMQGGMMAQPSMGGMQGGMMGQPGAMGGMPPMQGGMGMGMGMPQQGMVQQGNMMNQQQMMGNMQGGNTMGGMGGNFQ
mmetsp:Transcript_28506/g.59500  ORF Transcript_28506/g.59500 Transcript_28506/m.59500 type:complete len:688 (-) Transcript_28506:829-2892(-)